MISMFSMNLELKSNMYELNLYLCSEMNIQVYKYINRILCGLNQLNPQASVISRVSWKLQLFQKPNITRTNHARSAGCVRK